MFGPEGGLVRHYDASVSRLLKPSPLAAASATQKVTLRRIPLLPMERMSTHQGFTLALTQQQSFPRPHSFNVTTLPTKQLSLEVEESSWIATVVSEGSGKNAIPRLTEGSSPVAALVAPTPIATSSSFMAHVHPIHFICRCAVAPVTRQSTSTSSVTESLRKYHVAQDTAALKSINSNLAEDLVWEEEDPISFQKKRAIRNSVQQEEGDDATEDNTRKRNDDGRSAEKDVHSSKDHREPQQKQHASFLKTVPPPGRKRERGEDDDEIDAGHPSVLSPAVATDANHSTPTMPPPPRVAKVPLDLESKTALVVKKHRGKKVNVDEFWKEVARTLDEFKVVRGQSREAQTEWARVCKTSVLRFVQHWGCAVEDGTITVPPAPTT